MQNAVTRIRNQRSVVFTQIRCEKSVCTPTRANIMTGNACTNHQVASFDERFDYYDPLRTGRRTALPNITPTQNQFVGPYERDRALQRQQRLGGWGPAGAISQEPRDESVDTPSGGSVPNGVRPVKDQRFNTVDDLQYWTGSLPTWLAAGGVTCGLVGKYQNEYAKQCISGVIGSDPAAPNGWINTGNVNAIPAQTELFVPPGWSYWACLNGSDDPTNAQYGGGAQDHWAARYVTWEGVGDPFADAQGPATQHATFYKRPITSLTRVGSVATLVVGTHTAPTAPQGHMMTVGEEFAIEGATDSGWNYFMWTVASVIDANTITFNLAGTRPAPVTPQPPSLPSGTTAVAAAGGLNIFPRNQYGESLWGVYGVDFINKRSEGEPWFLYYAPDNPHEGSTDADGVTLASGVEVEKRYDPQGLANIIDWASIGLYWEGLKYWTADRVGPCTFAAGATRIFAADRRDDGSGPFDGRVIGRPVTDNFGGNAAGTFIPAGTVVTGVDSSLFGGTGGWVDISHPTVTSSGAGGVSRTICVGQPLANPDGYTTTYRQSYARRQGMLASADDTIGVLLDACEERGWHNVTLMVTSDNGWQQGEQDTHEETGSTAWYQKGRIYEGSVRAPLWIKGPDFPVKTTSHIVGSMKDLPMTVLDVFGRWGSHGGIDLTPFLTHHAHTKRDGRSLMRLLFDAADPEIHRAVYIFAGNGYGFDNGNTSSRNNYEGLVDENGVKFVRELGDTTLALGSHHLFVCGQDDNGRYYDYELTDLAGVYTALVTSLNNKLNLMRAGHWDPISYANTHRLASLA